MAILPKRHIGEAYDDAISYVDKRRRGIIRPIRYPWDKLNAIVGGIEPNTVTLIGAQSGGGKTALQNIIEDTVHNLPINQGMDIHNLTFNFEMLHTGLVIRKASREMQLTTQEISSTMISLSDDDFERFKATKEKFSRLNIEYIDTIGTVKDIEDTVIDKINSLVEFKKATKSKVFSTLVVSLDHTLLCKKEKTENERETLVKLAEMTNNIKHMYKPYVFVSWLLLTQTNRSLDDPERLNNPMLQFPVKSDIFGSDSLWHIADNVFVLMIPYRFGIEVWGVEKVPTKDKLFIHVLKNREGILKTLQFNENLKHNKIT